MTDLDTTQRINPNIPTSVYPVVIRRQVDAQAEFRIPATIATVDPYRLPPPPRFLPLGSGRDAWIGDMLQDPPTGPRPPLPPQPPTPGKAVRPKGFRPGHRKPAPMWAYALAGVGLALATFAAGWVACWVVAL